MSHDRSKKAIFLAPAPRTVSEIFDENDLTRLRTVADLVVHGEGQVTETAFDEHAARAEIIIGQIDLPESRLRRDRKSTRLNSSHQIISYAVFCLKKKNR